MDGLNVDIHLFLCQCSYMKEEPITPLLIVEMLGDMLKILEDLSTDMEVLNDRIDKLVAKK